VSLEFIFHIAPALLPKENVKQEAIQIFIHKFGPAYWDLSQASDIVQGRYPMLSCKIPSHVTQSNSNDVPSSLRSQYFAVVEAIRLDMLHRKKFPDPLQMPSPCPSPPHLPHGRFRRKSGHDIVEPGIEVFIPQQQPYELYIHQRLILLRNLKRHTVDAQLAVSNNLLDLSFLLQICQTSPCQ
jgi:hypothetical protein